MRSFDKHYNNKNNGIENKPSLKEQNISNSIDYYNAINICQHLKEYRYRSPDADLYHLFRRANQLLNSNEQQQDIILFNARELSHLLYEISNISKSNRGIKSELLKILLEEGLLNNWNISACKQLEKFNRQELSILFMHFY